MTQFQPNLGAANGPNSPSSQAGRGDLDLFDVIALAWSERGFIALVFAVLFAAGVTASLTMLRPSYTANLPLLIMLEDDPTPATAGMGGAFMLDQIMQSESELLNSDAVRRRALQQIGPSAVLSGALSGDVDSLALKSMRDSFSVSRSPNSSVLTARYQSRSAEKSARVLNAIIDAYLIYREDVLIEAGFAGLVQRRQGADTALVASQQAVDAFLLQNNLANFPADKVAIETSVSTLQDRLRTSRADRDAAIAGAGALTVRLRNVPEEIELYVENGVSALLLDRQSEQARLSARYQPTAPAMIAIEREIQAIEAFIASGAAIGQGVRRTGINPIRQAMMADLVARDATAQTEARRVVVLEEQLRAAQNEVARLRRLEPEYTQLAQTVAGATAATEALANLEASAASRRTSSPGAADSIRVFDRASPPLEGSSMKKLGLIGSFVMAAGLAMLLGLLRGYWRSYVRAQAMPVPGSGHSSHHHGHVQTQTQADMHPALADLPVLARVSERVT